MTTDGRELKRRRTEAGLTQAELADKAGTTANTIARMERGERGPSVSMLVRLAKALRCELQDLLPKRPRGGKQ